jgi:adenosylhomocysteine nucleosidase
MTGIIIATKIEAEPFIKGLGLSLISKKPFRMFGNDTVSLAISDIGKSSAAMATAHCIEHCKPSCIINLGAAGAVRHGFGVGDILHIQKIYEPDRRQLLRNIPVVHRPNTLKGFAMATLATQDRAAISDSDRRAAGEYADLADMEGAAVVQACGAYGVDVYLFKIITDTPGGGTMEIIGNILKTRHSLFEFFRDMVMPRL